MNIDLNISNRDRTPMNLVGSWVEVRWTGTHVLAKRQCEKCVYLVRGAEGPMICVELVYDAIDGEHRRDAIYWVEPSSIQYLRVLSDSEAQRRVEKLEREVMEAMPKD